MHTAIESRPSTDLDRLASSVRQQPLRALTLSAGAGFLFGGGLRSRAGLALGMFIGRSFAGTALINAIEALSEHNGRQHRAHQRGAGRGAAKSASDRD
jgi:hypothetical protein